MNNIRRLAFVGGGNMAAALISGLTKRGLQANRLVVADPSQEQLQRLVRDYAVETAADNAAAVQRSRGGGARREAATHARRGAWPGAASGREPATGDIGRGGDSARVSRPLVRPAGARDPHHAESAGAQRLRRNRPIRTRERRRRLSRIG